MTTNEVNIADSVDGPIPPRIDNDDWPGRIHTRIQDVVDAMGPAPWSRSLIWDERNNGTLIANDPGTGNIPHWHKDFDEWWIVMRGTLRWHYTGGREVTANEGDVVWVPRGSVHHIQNVGDGLSLRFAVSQPPAEHYASPCEACDYAPEVDPVFGIADVVAPGSLNITDTVEGPIPPRIDNADWPGVLHTTLDALRAKHEGEDEWHESIVSDERNIATLVNSPEGRGNNPHYHADFDEWWYVAAGQIRWELSGGKTFIASKGDLVWCPRGTTHHITTVSSEPSMRLAIAMPPGGHWNASCDVCGAFEPGEDVTWMDVPKTNDQLL
ncbi:MAG: cupin domain-containing protein [Dehalococcoidia bacterium]|nr:cupin domain-containing protein [Dehalococcoidia bacterium]